VNATAAAVDVTSEPWQRRAAEVALDASRDASLWPACEGCGGEFQPVRKKQKFCRPSCRKSAFRSRQLELKDMQYIEPDPARPD